LRNSSQFGDKNVRVGCNPGNAASDVVFQQVDLVREEDVIEQLVHVALLSRDDDTVAGENPETGTWKKGKYEVLRRKAN